MGMMTININTFLEDKHMNHYLYRLISAITALALAALACTVPDEIVEAIRRLPTITPTPAPLTLYVATTGNDSNDCLSEATACLTLYGANRKSTPGSTINIGPGEFTETYTSPGFRHNLILQGAGRDLTTINSSNYNVVVHVTRPADVTIRDLAIGHGGGDSSTGVQMVEGSNVTLIDCIVRNNTYAGVRNYGDRLTIQNCTITGNLTGIENSGSLTLTGSAVNNNQSGLFNGGIALIEDTTFDGNGIFVSASSAATTTITSGGELTMRGGGVSHSHGFGIIIRGGTAELDGVAVHDNDGIAVWHQEGRLAVRSSVISNNGSYGLNVGGRSGVEIGRVDISQTAIVGNHSAGLRIDGGEIHVQNTTISGNTATSSGGGGIWGYGGNLFLLDSTVAYNTGKGLELGTGSPDGGSVTVRRSVIALNSAEECQVDPRVSFSSGVFASYVCSESWTPATLKLRPLVADAGTSVHPIDADSPLVDAGGPTTGCPGVDQRSVSRPVGRTCDVGAYEYGGTSAAIVIATPEESDIIPLVTDTPTATPPPGEILLVLDKNANCRRGPGTVYSVLTSVLQGQTVQLIGRNNQNTWWLSIIPGNYKCWISIGTGQPDGDPNQLPVLPDPPTPTVTPKPDQGGTDFDKDGYTSDKDCNDKNDKIHPGAPETPDDKVDSNCNGNDDN
jgi:hypothetical protein